MLAKLEFFVFAIAVRVFVYLLAFVGVTRFLIG